MDYQSFQPNPPAPQMPEQMPSAQKILTPKFIALVVGLLVLGGVAYGGLWFWNDKNKEAVVPTVTPRVIDETAEWKTYTNAQYGFEFKYPKPEYESDHPFASLVKDGIYVKDDGNRITLIPQERKPQTHGQLVIYPVKGFALNDNWIQNYKKTEITIDGKKAILYEKLNADILGYIKMIKIVDLPINWDTTNVISYDLLDDSYPDSVKFFDRILSTFKFIDTVDTSTWKTYRNDQYGFEFKYPRDWQIQECKNTNCTKLVPIYGTIDDALIVEVVRGNLDKARTSLQIFKDQNNKVDEEGFSTIANLSQWKTWTIRNDLNFGLAYYYLLERDEFTYSLGLPFSVISTGYNEIISTFRFTK